MSGYDHEWCKVCDGEGTLESGEKCKECGGRGVIEIKKDKPVLDHPDTGIYTVSDDE